MFVNESAALLKALFGFQHEIDLVRLVRQRCDVAAFEKCLPLWPSVLVRRGHHGFGQSQTEQRSSALRELTAHVCNCLHDGTADDS